MGRTPARVQVFLTILLSGCLFGCGGGSNSIPPPPPAADFVLTISPNPVTVTQGSSSPAVNVTVAAENGFAGTVQVTLTGLPVGVIANPPSPFAVAPGAPVAVIFGVGASVAAGNDTVSAEGVSGALSHAAPFTLAVQAMALAAVPRTSFVRTDATAALDNPPGEVHHRHMIYDSARRQLFVANRAMNRIEVFSAVTQTHTAQINVPGASSVDISPDGTTVWVGTVTERIFSIDASSLLVKASYTLPAITPIPNTPFDRPEEVVAVAGGNFFLRMRQLATAESLLAIWNPASNAPSDLTSSEPQLFQNGLGAMARSGDGTRMMVAASDNSGELAIFDNDGNVVAGPRGLGAGTLPLVAANADASRFAVSFVSNGVTQLYLLDSALNPVAGPISANATSLVFSRDGNSLYAAQPAPSLPVINVFDGHSLALLGQVPDAAIEGVPSQLEDADATALLFALSNRGVAFVDATNPGTLPPAAPAFALAPVTTPAEGGTTGGTAIVLSGENFSALSQVDIGSQSASGFAMTSANELQGTSPPSASVGAANISAYFANGWLALAPDAFSYGAQILQILPNAGTSSGGDTVKIYGYGFGSDAGKVTVNIGGAAAAVQSVQNVATIAPALALDATYPFSLECITVRTPAGSAGKADVAVNSPAGGATAGKAFQFLQSEQFYAKPGLFKFLAYDEKRQWLYLSNIDHVDVLDLAAQEYRAPIEPPGGPPPDAGLRGLAVAPDGSQLVIADFGAQSVYLINPDSGTGTVVPVGGVPGFLNSGPASVAATSAQSVFVGLTGEGALGACSACLGQLNLAVTPPVIEPAPQPEVTSLTGAPLLQANAGGDHVFVAFGAAPGGPLALWQASAPDQFTIAGANSNASDIGASADGTIFAVQSGNGTEIHAQDLSLLAVPTAAELAQIPGRNAVPGITLHPSGALIYQPFLTGAAGSAGVSGGIDIVDAHSGVLRLRIFLAQQLMTDVDGLHGSFLATDENGQRLFAITSTDGTPQNSGVTVVRLANVPLGIGTVSPVSGAAAGGSTITIRGSGFVSGAKVSIGGVPTPATFKDSSTLTVIGPSLAAGAQQITITNPDGEAVLLDAAFIAN